jgi:hypothetical protein
LNSSSALPQRLSESLSQVLVHLEQELAIQTEPLVNAEVGRGPSLTLGQIERLLEGHGYELLLLFLALPFCFPISIPGLSLPFGLVIILIGWRLAVDRPPHLPKFIRNRAISILLFRKIIGFGIKLARFIERFSRIRIEFLLGPPVMSRLVGLGIASGGFLLLLPLPPFIPLSNTLPALSVIFFLGGLVERDGLLVLFGYLVNFLAWIYFGAMIYATDHGFSYLWHFFSR